MVRRLLKVLIAVSLTVSALGFGGSFELHFSAVIENDANDVFPDSFAASGSPLIFPDSLSGAAMFQPPGPPMGDYVQITQMDASEIYHRQCFIYDPNGPDLLYSMILAAFHDSPSGLSGNCVITLENPEALEDLPGDTLVYVRRFDNLDNFLESYDLSDPASHTFQWPVIETSGVFGRLDFLVVDKCMAADLMINDRIDLDDLAMLAADWDKSEPAAGDIFLDERVDLKDLIVLAEKWLCSCAE